MKESNKQDLKKALNEELQSIRLSNSSKRDIHYNATHAQPPSDRKILRYPALVAAALIIMLGASLYINSQQTLPDTFQKPSTVLTQGTATETPPPRAQPTPEPTEFFETPTPSPLPTEILETPIPTPLPTEVPMNFSAEDIPVWSAPGSHYYHLADDCSGLSNAEGMTESDALNAGKSPCPVCAVETVWCTNGGKYYHLTSNCSGMENASEMTESDAIDAGKSPCPVCAVETVWCTNGGKYYHLTSNCSGMENASEMTESDAIDAGKSPCPVCTVETVWCTNGGKYYHLTNDCSGMENAFEMDESDALKSGKAACPICFGDEPVYASSTPEPIELPLDDSTEEAMVWSTNGGKYYHLNSDCSGMENAHWMTQSDAIEAGKSPCSICFGDESVYASSTPEPTQLPLDDSTEEAMVWSSNGGKYYHLNSNCSGMENAFEMDESDAVESAKSPCPICFGDSEIPLVWSTTGSRYYHLISDCSGMENALEMTQSYAIRDGKSACPICIGNEDLNVSQTDAVHASTAESANDSVYDDIEALYLYARLSRYTLETGSFMVLDLNHDVNLQWLDAIENPSDWNQTEVSSGNIDFESELKDWLSLSDIESVQSTFEGNGAVGFEIVTVTPLLNDVNTEFSSNADAAPQGREYRLRATENAANKCVLYVLDQAISDDTARITLNIRHQQWYYDGHTIYRRIADNTVEEMAITILNGGTADIDEIPLEGLDADASLTLFTTDENRFLIFETEGDSDLSESCLVMDNGESIPPDMVTNTTMHGENMLIWRWDSRIASIHLTDGENTFDLPIPND